MKFNIFYKDVGKGSHLKRKGGDENRMSLRGESVVMYRNSFVGFVGLLLGMCERVRTRNTLYEVGAAKSKIWHNAVERRKMKKKGKERKVIKYKM